MHEIHTKAMENSHKSACSAIGIIEWFELFKGCKEEFGIQDADIWNFDENSCVCVARDLEGHYKGSTQSRELLA